MAIHIVAKYRNTAAFTLIEILVVVGVLIIIMTLALPTFLRARMNANEAIAMTSCRAIVTGCQSYYAYTVPHEYPSQLVELTSPISNPPYINSVLASGLHRGYKFEYSSPDENSFIITASPEVEGITGTKYFTVDETGSIQVGEGGDAEPEGGGSAESDSGGKKIPQGI